MAMSHLIHLMQNDPYFKQALKDFESLGFIKVNGENIKEFHTKHDKH